jgi:hypothetical protein
LLRDGFGCAEARLGAFVPCCFWVLVFCFVLLPGAVAPPVLAAGRVLGVARTFGDATRLARWTFEA